MQLGEIVIVLVIFFFILGAGAVFFTQFVADKTTEELNTVQELNLIETAKIVSNLPELHCSQRGDEDFTCIDYYRAQSFARNIEAHPQQYGSVFPNYRADLQCIYPCPTEAELDTFTLFDNIGEGKNTEQFVIPVLIYEPIHRAYSYGELTITHVT
jgi:hypothetical protein